MIFKMIITAAASAVLFGSVCCAAELVHEPVKTDDGLFYEAEYAAGDYEITIVTGSDEPSGANIFVNGGERVRAYTLEAGGELTSVTYAVPSDGKISILIKGENPAVKSVDISEIAAREAKEYPTIYIAGDSTAQSYNIEKNFPQTGWGQRFGEFFSQKITVENRAMAGRSSKSYNNDGRFDKILTDMAPGDYVFIQFGINDGAVNKPERYISAEDFKTLYSDKFIAEVKARGGIPVILNNMPKGDFGEDGASVYPWSEYAIASKEIAEQTDTVFIDVGSAVCERWNELGEQCVHGLYFNCEPLESVAYPTGTNDTTHFKREGAFEAARVIASAVKEHIPELAEYVQLEKSFEDTEGHWSERIVSAAASSGVIAGVDEAHFRPEQKVTRAEFIALAMRAAGVAGHAWREGECLDMTADNALRFDIQGAVDAELIPPEMIEAYNKRTEALEDGAERVIYEGQLHPDKEITREEMAAVTVNCMNAAGIDIKTDAAEFDDAAQISEWATQACKSGVMKGFEGKFRPKDTATRAEAAVIVNLIITARGM